MKKLFSLLMVAAALMLPVAMTGCGGAEDGGGEAAPTETADDAGGDATE